MRDPDKNRLDRLQAELIAQTGLKINQQELLARLVDLGEKEKDQLLKPPEKPNPSTLRALLDLPVKTGIKTREEEIDRAIYGESR